MAIFGLGIELLALFVGLIDRGDGTPARPRTTRHDGHRDRRDGRQRHLHPAGDRVRLGRAHGRRRVPDRGATGTGSNANAGLLFADAVAEETGVELNLLQAIPGDAPESQWETIERYHEELISTLTVPARSTIIEADDEVRGLSRFVGDADLLVTGVDRTGLSARLLGRPGNRLVDSVDTTAVMVQTRDGRRSGLLERLLMNHLFG